MLEQGFDSFLDYYYLLKYDDAAARATGAGCMDALSVPETYFWREIDQIQAIVDHVVPELVRAHRTGRSGIWSVPCATGEEPLTIAMMLERGRLVRARRDRDPRAATPARPRSPTGAGRSLPRRGRFAVCRRRCARSTSVTRTAAWVVGPGARIAASRRGRVVNLMDERGGAPRARCPIIFCRNVFIYFSTHGVRRVVERFASAMPSPGYLCVGASESLLKVTTRFELEEIARRICLRETVKSREGV